MNHRQIESLDSRFSFASLDGSVNFSDLLALAKQYDNEAALWAYPSSSDYQPSLNFTDLLALAKQYAIDNPGTAVTPTVSPHQGLTDLEMAQSRLNGGEVFQSTDDYLVDSRNRFVVFSRGGELTVRRSGNFIVVDDDGVRLARVNQRMAKSILIYGTSDAQGDVIRLGDTGKIVTVRTLSGADTVYGSDGDETIDGGVGADQIHGGGGNDTLLGGDGADRLWGDAGDDRLEGGGGVDRLDGGAGVNRITGGYGVDYLTANANDRRDPDKADRLTLLE